MNAIRPTQRESVLVLGTSGMLGNAVFRYFWDRKDHDVIGSVRSSAALSRFPAQVRTQLVAGVNVEDPDHLMRLLASIPPSVGINCVGVVKQLTEADDALVAIPLNALLPHRLARICAIGGARLIPLRT